MHLLVRASTVAPSGQFTLTDYLYSGPLSNQAEIRVAWQLVSTTKVNPVTSTTQTQGYFEYLLPRLSDVHWEYLIVAVLEVMKEFLAITVLAGCATGAVIQASSAFLMGSRNSPRAPAEEID